MGAKRCVAMNLIFFAAWIEQRAGIELGCRAPYAPPSASFILCLNSRSPHTVPQPQEVADVIRSFDMGGDGVEEGEQLIAEGEEEGEEGGDGLEKMETEEGRTEGGEGGGMG